MDERSQHGHPQPHHAAAQEHAQAMPQAAGSTPWPSYVPPVPNAPIAGRAPYPGPGAQQQLQQLPTTHQFQYAANGYVLPGASEAQGAPMSAHGGTIGVAQPYQPAAPMAMPAAQPVQPQAYAQPQGYAQPQAYGAGAQHQIFDANGQQQTWAFPTPAGMQLVQPGATSMAQAGSVHGTMPGGATARRLRWETIVPAAAVMCLIAAIGLFMHDFDRITGRDTESTSARSAETTTQVDAAPKAATGDAQAVVSSATALFRKGRYDQAANLLHPLLDVPAPDPAVVALHDKVDAANAREDALLRRLSTERRGKRWTAVVATIGQVERLRPLDRQLISLRTRARAAATAAKAARAKAISAKRAAAKLKAASPSAHGGGGSGSHQGHKMPPVAGGNTGATSNVRPPADVPKGSIPAVPNVPNPTGNVGTGAAAVGGGMPAAGTGSNCHAHDGVTSCHD